MFDGAGALALALAPPDALAEGLALVDAFGALLPVDAAGLGVATLPLQADTTIPRQAAAPASVLDLMLLLLLIAVTPAARRHRP